ncbi:MAG: glycosyltransferase family 39 protein [Candidatus Omnitrophica bacterium]|nr:glycosyltransferase family 39 protein [Candidatus Omnitrophota bacterium]
MFIKNIQDFLLATICLAILTLLSQILGKRLINLAKLQLQPRLENFLVSQALGLSVISYMVFFLGLIGAVKRINFIIIFWVILPLLCSPEIKNSLSGLKHNLQNLKLYLWFKNKRLLSKIALALFALFVLGNFLNCFTPPIERDAMTYHLRMPQSYIKTGHVSPEPNNIFSYFPQLTEMLYTFGLMFSNDYSSHLIHFYFGILAALTIFLFVRRISNTETALFSALAFYSLPIVSQLSTWAYVDLALCFFTMLALYFFSRAIEDTNWRLLKLSAVLFGFAFSVKYLSFISLYIILIISMIHFIRIKSGKRATFIKEILYFSIILIIVALPWYLRNILVTGNPVYPLFYSIFKGPHWDMERARLYDILLGLYGMGRSLMDYMLLPWRMAVYGGLDGPFDAQIGLTYIVLAPLLIFFRPRHKSANYILIYSAIFFFIWTTLSQQSRFLLPAFAALSICLYAVFDCAFKGSVINRRSILILAIGLMSYNLILSWQYFQKHKPLEFIIGKTSRQQYLMKYLKDYPAINYMNNNLSDESKTYMVSIGNIGYYCRKGFIQESVFDYTFEKVVKEAVSPQEIFLWLKNQGASHILINEVTASRYLYSDLGWPQLNTYDAFRKTHLSLIYTNGVLFLYQIV